MNLNLNLNLKIKKKMNGSNPGQNASYLLNNYVQLLLKTRWSAKQKDSLFHSKLKKDILENQVEWFISICRQVPLNSLPDEDHEINHKS